MPVPPESAQQRDVQRGAPPEKAQQEDVCGVAPPEKLSKKPSRLKNGELWRESAKNSVSEALVVIFGIYAKNDAEWCPNRPKRSPVSTVSCDALRKNSGFGSKPLQNSISEALVVIFGIHAKNDAE